MFIPCTVSVLLRSKKLDLREQVPQSNVCSRRHPTCTQRDYEHKRRRFRSKSPCLGAKQADTLDQDVEMAQHVHDYANKIPRIQQPVEFTFVVMTFDGEDTWNRRDTMV